MYITCKMKSDTSARGDIATEIPILNLLAFSNYNDKKTCHIHYLRDFFLKTRNKFQLSRLAIVIPMLNVISCSAWF